MASSPVLPACQGRVIACSVTRPVSLHILTAGKGWELRDTNGAFVSCVRRLSSAVADRTPRAAPPPPADPANTTPAAASTKSATVTSDACSNLVWVTPVPGISALPEAMRPPVEEACMKQFQGVVVKLPKESLHALLMGYAVQQLKSVLHDSPPTTALDALGDNPLLESKSSYISLSHDDGFGAYEFANASFVDTLVPLLQAGDTIVIDGYPLFLLPGLLRKRVPEELLKRICIIMVVSTPWPTYEMYRCLPQREAILRGILGSDVLSFQDFTFLRHFYHSAIQVLGVEAGPSCVVVPQSMYASAGTAGSGGGGSATAMASTTSTSSRVVRLLTAPVGTDFAISRRYNEKVRAEFKDIQRALGGEGRKIIISVDKLEEYKGTVYKLLAYETMLREHPELHGKVVYYLFVRDPLTYLSTSGAAVVKSFKAGTSIGAVLKSVQLLRDIHELVGRIVGTLGQFGWSPVVLHRQAVHRDTIDAMLALADVALMPSLNEGFTIPAMEYVRCKTFSFQRPGVLIYSECAGGASGMPGALICNPLHTERMAATLHTALAMSEPEVKARMQDLIAFYETRDPIGWAVQMHTQAFGHSGHALLGTSPMVSPRTPVHVAQPMHEIAKSFGRGGARKHRSLILSYEALVPLQPVRSLCQPTELVARALHQLARQPHLTVWIVATHSVQHMHQWLGHLPFGLVAENGYYLRFPATATPHTSTTRRPHQQHHDGNTRSEEGSDAHHDAASQPWLALFSDEDAPVTSTATAPTPSAHSGDTATSSDSEEASSAAADGSSGASGGSSASVAPELRLDVYNPPTPIILTWHHGVVLLMKYYCERTPGSTLDVGPAWATWCYKLADGEYGSHQAQDMQLHLDSMLAMSPAEVIVSSEKQTISVRHIGVSKLGLIERLPRLADNAGLPTPTVTAVIADNVVDTDILAGRSGKDSSLSFYPLPSLVFSTTNSSDGGSERDPRHLRDEPEDLDALSLLDILIKSITTGSTG